MERASYSWFRGVVTDVRAAGDGRGSGGCLFIYRIEDEERSLAEFLITPDTYFVNQARIELGMPVIGFYDMNAPMVMSFPPRYQPIAVAMDDHRYNMKMDCFDEHLMSLDGQLVLNIGPDTRVSMTNGQNFYGELGGRLLLVLYGVTTRSIPARTTPGQIVVFCQRSCRR